MGSLPNSADQSLSIELQQPPQPHPEANGPVGHRAEQSQWLLNSPEPPSLWQELTASLRSKFSFDGGKNKKNASKKERSNAVNRVVLMLQSIFPILRWGREYKLSMFKRDLMAGLTLASLSIPQSIGYANLAKLDPEYGLYTSVVPPLIYSIMGSSREIAIGPVAVVSLLLSAMVGSLQDPAADPVAYRKLVFTVTLFAGMFQAIFGLFRLGFLVDFLSHAALVGFMAGAAIVIGLQQLKGLLGLSHFTTKTDIIAVLDSVFGSLRHKWYPLNFIIGCSFLIFLLTARYIGRKNKKLFWFPAIAPLVSVILSTLIVFLAKADKHGVKIVKHIEAGLNPSSARQLQLTGPQVGETAKIGLISAIIALTEAIAVGRSFASINGYHLDGNKEMMAMGFMNIAGSLTSCYVATGSFSRTAVNFSAGCQTVVSNIVMAVTVLLSLELFMKLLYYTPITILASIILSALPGLIDINAAIHIWKLDKLDFIACLGAFLGVLFASVEIGLLIAVAISVAKVLFNSIRPGIESLGRLPSTNVYGDTTQYPMAVKTSGVLTLRISSPLLCFANSNFIRERIMNWVLEEEEENSETRVQYLVLDMSNVKSVDTTGLVALEELQKELVPSSIQLAIANPRWQVLHKLKLAKFDERIGSNWIFLTVDEAVNACLQSKSTVLNTC